MLLSSTNLLQKQESVFDNSSGFEFKNVLTVISLVYARLGAFSVFSTLVASLA